MCCGVAYFLAICPMVIVGSSGGEMAVFYASGFLTDDGPWTDDGPVRSVLTD